MEVYISGALPDEKMEYCSASPGIDLGAESAAGSAEEQLLQAGTCPLLSTKQPLHCSGT